MTRLHTVLFPAVLVAFASVGVTAEARQSAAPSAPEAVMRSAAASSGSILGIVTDDRGAPLQGAMVSALGASMAFAVTDAGGRFALQSLPPGAYLVRAHLAGFAASRRVIIEVRPSARAHSSLMLHPVAAPEDAIGTSGTIPARQVLVAGVAAPEAPQSANRGESGSPASPDDHSEPAWRLRHLKRSVLKETTDFGVVAESAEPDDGTPGFFGKAVGSPARLASTLFTEFPFSGELNLLTTSSFDRAQEIFSADRVPRGVAYLTIGAPAGVNGNWSVHGAMTQGDVSSWVLAGLYANRGAGHLYDVGMSYSTQRYDGGNPAALAAVSDGRRNVGTIYGDDEWRVSGRTTIEYGARYARYDYLEGSALFGARVGMTLSATDHTRLVAAVSQRRVAPGAEEFLPPPVAGLWLPPQRTFAPLAAGTPFRAERARHVEIALEHDLSNAYVVGIRRFYQQVDDQLATLFGVRLPDGPRLDLGHYYVASSGNAEIDGWGVTFRRSMAGRLQGSVDYTLTRARWAMSPDAELVAIWAPSVRRQDTEEFHDVTTSVETNFPETATRLFVIYKINTAFSRPETDAATPAVDARFDVQVHQGLPFLQFTNARWELLVAVRNLFREPQSDSSPYDELLVVRPPKRIVGGLLVKF